jgi:hypothetical protein
MAERHDRFTLVRRGGAPAGGVGEGEQREGKRIAMTLFDDKVTVFFTKGTSVGNKPNHELTSTQKAAWTKYKRFEERHARPPTVREFAELLGQDGPSNAHRLITLFRDQGLLAPRRVTETRLMVSAKGRRTS